MGLTLITHGDIEVIRRALRGVGSLGQMYERVSMAGESGRAVNDEPEKSVIERRWNPS